MTFWQDYEIDYILSRLPKPSKTQIDSLSESIAIKGETLQIYCKSEAAIADLIRKVHPTIAQTVRANPEAFAVSQVRYVHKGCDRLIPLILSPDLMRFFQPATRTA